MATLKEKYRSEIAPALKEELGLSNMMEVPRITKITLNMGVGEAVGDKKVMENALSDMTKILGRSQLSRNQGSRLLVLKSAMAGPLDVR